MLKPWCIHRHRCQWWRRVFCHWECQLAGTSNLCKSRSAENNSRKIMTFLWVSHMTDNTRGGRMRFAGRPGPCARTALMPLSCWAVFSRIMVRSCQRIVRSVKSSHGFLACTPTALFLSSLILSHSRSQASPCSRLRASHRGEQGCSLWLRLRPHACWCLSHLIRLQASLNSSLSKLILFFFWEETSWSWM